MNALSWGKMRGALVSRQVHAPVPQQRKPRAACVVLCEANRREQPHGQKLQVVYKDTYGCILGVANNCGYLMDIPSMPIHQPPRCTPQVVFITTEIAPWSKVGGLADVLAGLPAALAARYVPALMLNTFPPPPSHTHNHHRNTVVTVS